MRATREAGSGGGVAAEASARNRAAVIIQSRLRGGEFVRKRRAEYLVALRRLQMAVRRWVLRMKWKRLESERLEKEEALEASRSRA